jgi:hypothetical protein
MLTAFSASNQAWLEFVLDKVSHVVCPLASLHMLACILSCYGTLQGAQQPAAVVNALCT